MIDPEPIGDLVDEMTTLRAQRRENKKLLPRFTLTTNGQVWQALEGTDFFFDPESFGRFSTKGGPVVRAVRIPVPFYCNGDLCKDGYLVVADGHLKALSAETFNSEYVPA